MLRTRVDRLENSLEYHMKRQDKWAEVIIGILEMLNLEAVPPPTPSTSFWTVRKKKRGKRA